jgi:hypothetical protein
MGIGANPTDSASVDPENPTGLWSWMNLTVVGVARSGAFNTGVLRFMAYRRTIEAETLLMGQAAIDAAGLRVADIARSIAGSIIPVDVDELTFLHPESNACAAGRRDMLECELGKYEVFGAEPNEANLARLPEPANIP